jgi:hypothetical protein
MVTQKFTEITEIVDRWSMACAQIDGISAGTMSEANISVISEISV